MGCFPSNQPHPFLSSACSEAAAHAVATLAEATLQGGGQIVLSGETAAAVGALTGVQDANGKRGAQVSWVVFGFQWVE